jgi:hypothetical protein
MASPVTFIPESSFQTIGVSLAFGNESMPSHLLTRTTAGGRPAVSADSVSATEANDDLLAYRAGNGGQSPDDVATNHARIQLGYIMQEDLNPRTAEEFDRVEEVRKKYRALVLAFVQRKTGLTEAAKKFAKDLAPLGDRLSSALRNPIFKRRLMREY